ncbi:MAG: hypothetical protein LBG61_05910 [Burkholderiales bacterium]|jgi:hypothetical protein|nr:hypothetical protein [Burkholderiales bacterium]
MAWAVMAAVTFILGCGTQTTVSATEDGRSNMTETTPIELAPELKPTKTWCMGRYQIDTPETMAIFEKYVPNPKMLLRKMPLLTEYGGDWKYRFVKFVFPNERMSHEAFDKKLKAREEELKNTPNTDDGGGNMFVKSLRVDADSHIIVRWVEKYSKDLAVIEGYKWSNGVVFHLDWEIGGNPDQIERAVPKTVEKLAQLQGRGAREVPTVPGFCVPDGIFVEKEQSYDGSILASFMMPERPDINLVVYIGYIPPSSDPGLLSRKDGIFAKFGNMAHRVKTLRADKRPLPGAPKGEELLVTLPEDKKGRVHAFIWEDMGWSKDHPFLRIELNTGIFNHMPSISDQEALAMWDAILNSFKLRSVDPQTGRADEAFPKTVATGEKCPKDGRWMSVEDGSVLKFVAGQIMPPVIFAKPAEGFFAKLTGKTTTYQAPGHWAWVEEKA